MIEVPRDIYESALFKANGLLDGVPRQLPAPITEEILLGLSSLQIALLNDHTTAQGVKAAAIASTTSVAQTYVKQQTGPIDTQDQILAQLTKLNEEIGGLRKQFDGMAAKQDMQLAINLNRNLYRCGRKLLPVPTLPGHTLPAGFQPQSIEDVEKLGQRSLEKVLLAYGIAGNGLDKELKCKIIFHFIGGGERVII